QPKDGQGQPKNGQGQPKNGQGQPKPGQGQGQPKEGQGQPKDGQKGKSQEKNEPKGTGQRVADGKVNNTESKANGTEGDGSFLNLPPRQRELIRQALSDKLPPEYASLIQQYFVNIAKGKPAMQEKK